MRGCPIDEVVSHIHLGLTLQSNMPWNNHEHASQRLNMIKPLKFEIDRSTLVCLYKSGFIRPTMQYGDIIWDNCTAGNSELLESVQYQSAKVVTGAIRGTSSNSRPEELTWEELSIRRKIHKLSYFFIR